MPESETGRWYNHELPCRYINCEAVIANLDQLIRQIGHNEVIMLEATDPKTPDVIPAYCQLTQNKYLTPVESKPDLGNPQFIVFTHFVKKI